ncbi:MAG TPA: hypothetical protein VGQ53_17735 [Chitinophagaceae bacterium]|nr:hypothetical protein [Chitinophagaceae bacterium]
MRIFRLAALIIGFIAGVTACKKELNNSDCDGLRDGLLKNDVKLVTKNIGSLLSSYSEGTLDLLANEITDRCNIPATVDCFNCIKTNPPQTEIIFSLVQQGGTVQKRLDISYTSNNKMVLLNVHD